MKARLPVRTAFLAMASIIAAGPSAAGVTVVGNVRVDADSIRAHVPAVEGDTVTDAALDDAVKSLFASGQFDDVKAERSGKGVKVTVVERPVLAAIRFEGNALLSDARLLQASGLRPGQWVSQGDLEAAALAMSQAYSATGRVDAVVRLGREAVADGIAATFLIEEGSRTGVAHIWFRGNESFSDARLRSVVSTKRSGWLGWLRNDDVYDPDRVEADRKALERFYLSQGFAEARVETPEIDRLDEGFAVGFVIAEGPRYAVASTSIDSSVEGFGVEGHPALERLEGRFLDPGALAKAAAEIEESALRSGVPSPVAVPRTTLGRDGRADVRVTVDAGPRVYVDRIEIEGNVRTRDWIIRRELDFAEGDLLDRAMLRRAERRLRALGLFSDVSFDVLPGNAGDRAVLRISVKERNTGKISGGGGYSTRDGPLASASLSQSNIGGTGRRGALNVSLGERTSAYGASWTEPWLFGRRVAATADVYREMADRESLSEKAYAEAATGARLVFSAPLTERFGASLGYGIERREVSDVDPLFAGSGMPGDPDLVAAGRFLKSSLSWSLDYDARDDALLPRDGYRLGFRQELAGLGGDVTFLKTEASAQWYMHLAPSRDVAGLLSARGGVVSGLGRPLSFPDHFEGGPAIVRGFARDGFGPYDATTGFHLGGTAFAAATAEASMPLPFLPPELGLRGAVFADAGTVWTPDARRVAESGATVAGDGGDLRVSIGAGILWDSPLGALRADFAVPVVRQDGDRTQAFMFSGGARF